MLRARPSFAKATEQVKGGERPQEKPAIFHLKLQKPMAPNAHLQHLANPSD